jgi:hypothetical protein
MINVDDLKAGPGQRVGPRFRELVKRLRGALQLTMGAGVRSRRGPDGVTVVADAGGGWVFVPAFKVRLINGNAACTVGLGLIGGKVPVLGEGGNALDVTEPAVPQLDLTKVQPAAETPQWTWVALRVRVGEQGQLMEEGGAEVLHVAELRSQEEEPLTGMQPLALVQWDKVTKRITGVSQVVMHNLEFALTAVAAGQRRRFYFWGV